MTNMQDNDHKQHYDFLLSDLQTKQLRYQLHEYMMHKMHNKLIRSPTENDILV